jgi:uncharacterized protein HemX
MFKRWFEFSSNGKGASGIAERRNGSTEHALALLDPQESDDSPRAPASLPGQPSSALPLEYVDLQQVYRNPAVKAAQIPCGILKVVDMVNSEHLSGLSPEAKRCAIMMALEAVGAGIEDLLQDAVARQRALNDYEKEQQYALRRFEETKAEEKRKLQSELEGLTTQYMARVQANADEVSGEQEKFRAWQRKKHQESQRIAEAAAFCVPDGLAPHTSGLSSVLERAAGARR